MSEIWHVGTLLAVTLCTILQAAVKKEQSEELLTHCFMAEVRVSLPNL